MKHIRDVLQRELDRTKKELEDAEASIRHLKSLVDKHQAKKVALQTQIEQYQKALAEGPWANT